jgi:hypothetical protein
MPLIDKYIIQRHCLENLIIYLHVETLYEYLDSNFFDNIFHNSATYREYVVDGKWKYTERGVRIVVSTTGCGPVNLGSIPRVRRIAPSKRAFSFLYRVDILLVVVE